MRGIGQFLRSFGGVGVGSNSRRHRYGIRLIPTWPHVSLGISAHIDRKYGHLSLHLPVGVLIIGFVGADE